MRAISIRQPWAGLVAAGIKLVENRDRPIIPASLFGEQVAIHASRKIDEDAYDRIAEIAPDVLRYDGRTPIIPCRRDWYRLSRITGAVIGVGVPFATVRSISQILDVNDKRWYFGLVAHVFRDMRALAEPVACRGMLGCWTLPTDVERLVRVQLPCGAGGTHSFVGHDVQCTKCLAEAR